MARFGLREYSCGCKATADGTLTHRCEKAEEILTRRQSVHFGGRLWRACLQQERNHLEKQSYTQRCPTCGHEEMV